MLKSILLYGIALPFFGFVLMNFTGNIIGMIFDMFSYPLYYVFLFLGYFGVSTTMLTYLVMFMFGVIQFIIVKYIYSLLSK